MTAVKGFAPQIRRKQSTFSMMMEVTACLLLVYLVSLIFYSVKVGPEYGLKVVFNGLSAVGFAVLADCLWYLPVLFRKDQEKKAYEYFYRIGHSYSYVSGLILVLLLPVGIQWWEIAVTALLSILVMKLCFGGFGSNILNPAVFGRVFAQLAFAKDLTTYLGTKPADFSVATGASVTGQINAANGFSALNSLSLGDLFLGNYRGALGETCALLLILIGIYLSVRKIIDWRVPVFYVLSLYLSFVLLFLTAGDGGWAFKDALSYTLVGGILFGGVFCLTDPVTSPTSRSGRVIFALGAALLTLLLRVYTASPEGVAYSILFLNVLVPLIDHVIKGRTRRKLVPTLTCAVLGVLLVIFSLSYGATHKIDPATLKYVAQIGEGF